MKYINNYKLFEKLNQIDLLLEDFNDKEFIDFYNKVQQNVQTIKNVNILIDNEILNKIIDLNDKNQFTIKDDRHIKQIKPSKLIKESDPTELEKFSNIIKSYNIKSKVNFKELSGEGCQKYFYQKNDIKKGSHFLKNDCMRYNECQDYFKIIEKNPEKISILYAFQNDLENNLAGFCLLFNINGQKYYDRIYGHSIEHAILIENYCIKHNYKNVYRTDGEKYDIQLKEWLFDNYPYMDTFKFLDIKNGILSNYLKDNLYIFEMNSPQGDIYFADSNDDLLWNKLEDKLSSDDIWKLTNDINSKNDLVNFIKKLRKYLAN